MAISADVSTKGSTDAGSKGVPDIEDFGRDSLNPIRKAIICRPLDE